MLRSVLAILAGFLSMMVLVMPFTVITARVMLGTRTREDMMKTPPTPAYVNLNLLFSGLAAVLGGFVAGRVATHVPLGHAAVLATFMAVFGFVSWRVDIEKKTAEGRRFGGTLVVLGPVCALIGGWLASSLNAAL
ncbi:MAG TPA: hypothetical protein VF483_01305 [Gemmatimonadaceae bacterium]